MAAMSVLEEEVALRREAALVPFSRACLLRLSGESAAAARLPACWRNRYARFVRPPIAVAGAPCSVARRWSRSLATAAAWARRQCLALASRDGALGFPSSDVASWTRTSAVVICAARRVADGG